jgi:hypothetical protein
MRDEGRKVTTGNSQNPCPYVVVEYVAAATAILTPFRPDVPSGDKSSKEDHIMRFHEFTDQSRYFCPKSRQRKLPSTPNQIRYT